MASNARQKLGATLPNGWLTTLMKEIKKRNYGPIAQLVRATGS